MIFLFVFLFGFSHNICEKKNYFDGIQIDIIGQRSVVNKQIGENCFGFDSFRMKLQRICYCLKFEAGTVLLILFHSPVLCVCVRWCFRMRPWRVKSLLKVIWKVYFFPFSPRYRYSLLFIIVPNNFFANNPWYLVSFRSKNTIYISV